MNIFSRIKAAVSRVFLTGKDHKRADQTNKLAAIPYFSASERRADRKRARRLNWITRSMRQRIGPPVLTGARLERVCEQCSPRHLTVQPRYRSAEFKTIFQEACQ